MMNKIRVLIVDDEPLARERVRRLLRDEADLEIVGEAGNGKDAVAMIGSAQPDLVFLDIQMPEKTGFDVIRSLPDDAPQAFIFVTAYDHYALQAFDVHAIDYLLKPINRERLKRSLERARRQIEGQRAGDIDARLALLIADLKTERRYLERLVVKTTGRVFFVKTDDVDWIEASGNYLKLHVGRDGHLIRETMNSIESKLDPARFVRIHRSTIVNIDRIKELQPMFSGDYAVILINGRELTLSRNFRDAFLDLFERRF